MLSTTQMIRRLEGMVGSKDLSNWETRFVRSVVARLETGEVTKLSALQVETLERLHDKHFA